MLFDPLEEQLYLPAIPIAFGNRQSGKTQQTVFVADVLKKETSNPDLNNKNNIAVGICLIRDKHLIISM
jgi:hypothetical protein